MSEYNQSYAQPAPATHSGGHGAPAAAGPSKKLAIFAIVGALIVLVGSLVNWVVSDTAGDGGVKGTDGDGTITLIVSIVMAIVFIAALVTKKGMLYLVGAIGALVSAVFAVKNMMDPEALVITKAQDKLGVSEKVAEQAVKQLELSAGPGIYMVLVGALLALALGALGFMKSRAAR
ncbi:hypothetical protein VT50_0201160 [Streptomyces antioxidans]|uniref:Uncharacterized protein n=1 Tax=Streptomyces antioxidans TaxID=1507734 RepID=A0A1V4DD77_9ACTN|nr:Trp biosynthesis-associated membrane protein [Streptomyces antioxidans]OPF84666.1 hypothetical protein VT50_0201160 [Streptomyces antioxidans]